MSSQVCIIDQLLLPATDIPTGIAPMYCIVAYVYIGDKVNGGVVTCYIPARTDGKR